VPAPAVSPIVAALDHPEVTLDQDTAPVAALSLVEALAQIPDPRKARGIRHGVVYLAETTMALLASPPTDEKVATPELMTA
jgi:hypothetical protein